MPETQYLKREVRVFQGQHGELEQALEGTLASLRSWHTHPDRVEALYAVWVEEEGWQVCVVLKD